jgi:SAM-dependent methyltransferase
VVAIDLSFEALRRLPPPRSGTILRLCADGHHLPLKGACADTFYSVDTLGHVAQPAQVLDEILRVVKPDAQLFLHSECSDYRDRWPDRMLIKRLGYDLPARHDGHISLLPVAALRALVSRRFLIDRIWSPAGLTGWLTGYPEKYLPAFRAAHCRTLAFLTAVFAFVKKTPVAGFLLRLGNGSLNHLEIALGIQGGGSVFILLHKPMDTSGQDASASGQTP